MLNRLKAYFRLDRDMDDEMSIHIEQYREDLIRQGVPPAEAQWQARRAFGNRSRISEDGRWENLTRRPLTSSAEA